MDTYPSLAHTTGWFIAAQAWAWTPAPILAACGYVWGLLGLLAFFPWLVVQAALLVMDERWHRRNDRERAR